MNKTMNRRMTAEQAKSLSLEIWRYLAEHTEVRSKRELPFPLYAKINGMCGKCPMCEYNLKQKWGSCNDCPIGAAGYRCAIDGKSLWFLWTFTSPDKVEIRKEAALKIIELIENWDTGGLQ
jgi:hypothetical protein